MIQFIKAHLANSVKPKKKDKQKSFLLRHKNEVMESYVLNCIGNINNDSMF